MDKSGGISCAVVDDGGARPGLFVHMVAAALPDASPAPAGDSRIEGNA